MKLEHVENSMEEWVEIAEHPGYLISNWGRVLNFKTRRFLVPYIRQSRSNRYLRVEISKKKHMVHLLVAKYHMSKPPTEEHVEVNHKDRNTLNPHKSNLEWTTKSDNKKHVHQTQMINFDGDKFRAYYKSGSPVKKSKSSS